jgi:hypothetical protein
MKLCTFPTFQNFSKNTFAQYSASGGFVLWNNSSIKTRPDPRFCKSDAQLFTSSSKRLASPG